MNADLGVREVWTPQGEALFDVRVADTDVASYVNHPVSAVLASAEEEKKHKYLSAELCHASLHVSCCFAPVIHTSSPLSCCFVPVTLLCPCHAALPLSYCFENIFV